MKYSRGFTLIELMVAMAVMSVVVSGSYIVFEQVQRAQDRLDAHQTRLSKLQNTMNYFDQDWKAALLRRGIRDEYGDIPTSGFIGTENVLEWTRRDWRRVGLSENEQRSELQRVRYRLDQERLMRDHWQTLDRSQDAVPVSTLLMENIESIKFRYLFVMTDPNNPVQASSNWSEAWPPTDAQFAGSAQPELIAIEFTCVSKDWGEIIRRYSALHAPAAPVIGV
ncbi:MAG: type II secretion system minor pseudopilin GspJ [Pseudomonadota bacterium]